MIFCCSDGKNMASRFFFFLTIFCGCECNIDSFLFMYFYTYLLIKRLNHSFSSRFIKRYIRCEDQYNYTPKKKRKWDERNPFGGGILAWYLHCHPNAKLIWNIISLFIMVLLSNNLAFFFHISKKKKNPRASPPPTKKKKKNNTMPLNIN